MLLDNSQVFSFSRKTPITQLEARGYARGEGLMGLGEEPAAGPTSNEIQSAIAALNSELTYLVNLYRVQTGQAPLPASMAGPGVTVGLAPEVIWLGLGALALYLSSRKRRRA